ACVDRLVWALTRGTRPIRYLRWHYPDQVRGSVAACHPLSPPVPRAPLGCSPPKPTSASADRLREGVVECLGHGVRCSRRDGGPLRLGGSPAPARPRRRRRCRLAVARRLRRL